MQGSNFRVAERRRVMRVKAATTPVLALTQHFKATTLERDPAFIVSGSPAPFRIISPTREQCVSPVIIAAVRARKAPEKRSSKRGAESTKEKAVPGQAKKLGCPKRKAEVQHVKVSDRNVRPCNSQQKHPIGSNIAKILSGTAPFKQVCVAGMHSTPTTIIAEPVDIKVLLAKKLRRRKQEAARKKQQAEKTAAQEADGRVALRVLPAGQVPSEKQSTTALKLEHYGPGQLQKNKIQKNGRQNDHTTTQGKSHRKGSPPLTRDGNSDGKAQAQSRGAPLPQAQPLGVEWHPGMRSAYGINFIDLAVASSAHPPPPVLEGSTRPSRYASTPLRFADLPKFPDDELRASVECLHYLAVTVGRLLQYPPRVQQVFNAEQRMYRERLSRILTARDGRRLEKSHRRGTRKSERTRFASVAFLPKSNGSKATGVEEVVKVAESVMERADPALATDVRLGQEFQADLPMLQRPRATPTAEEFSRCGAVVVPAGAVPLPPRDVEQAAMAREWSREQRSRALDHETAKLIDALDHAAAAAMGLQAMGATMSGILDSEQQEALYFGMKEHGRNFHAITKNHLPGLAPRELAGYYYDVWKLRAVPSAERWYADRAAEAAERENAAIEAEKIRAQEAARRAERHEASARRRQVKEAVTWVRQAAKGPSEVNFNKPIVRERAGRVVSVRYMPPELRQNRNIAVINALPSQSVMVASSVPATS